MALLMANTFNWPNAIAQAIESYGFSSRDWFAQWHLPYPQGLHYCHQVELGYLEDFLVFISQKTGDDLFIYRVHQYFSPTMLDSFGIALMSSKNIADAFRRTMNILGYVTDSIDFNLLEKEGDWRINMHLAHRDSLPLCKLLMLTTTQKLLQILVAPDFCFRRVELDFPLDSAYKVALDTIFRCPVEVDSSETAFHFNPRELMGILPGANDDMAEIHEKMFYQRLHKSLDKNISLQVKTVLIEHLPRGECSKDFVAKQLGMKGRTLQYRLSKEGVNFKVLLEKTRFELAQNYLQQQRSFTEIAHQLGYTDTSNFQRAFKAWQQKAALTRGMKAAVSDDGDAQ